MFASLLLALSLSAHAKTLAGVTLPDTVPLGGQTVTLNGVGLREKFFVDIYVGGLYLTHPTRDADTAIAADEPKRVVMHFIYNAVTREQIVETFHEGFGGLPGVAAQQANVDKVIGWVPAAGVVRGDEMVFDYVPGTGTTFYVKGKAMGTIPGTEFMKLVFGVYLGPKPPTEDLKRGMLGA